MQTIVYKGWRARAAVFLVCLPVLQTLFFPFMPGLNSDMARLGIEASRIVRGEHLRLAGVTPYGGTVRIYLIALSSLLFGMNRLALELPFALFNSLTILCVYLLVRRLFSPAAAIICALVLSLCPWFVIRNIDNWYYFSASLAFLLMSRNSPRAFLIAGVVLGIACYEHQLSAVICLAALAAWLVCGRKDRAGIRGLLYTAAGCALGFMPRILYALCANTGVYVEPFNAPRRALSDALMFIPYFGGMVDGTVIYLRNAGCITWFVVPINTIVLIGAAGVLLTRRRQRLYPALLVFFACVYLLPFFVINYTAIRYFLSALFAAALITGLGIYELSLRSMRAAVAVLALFCGANLWYLCADFFIPFGRTGGTCLLFRLGTLVEASHHLVRTDLLYECLDKDVPVIVTPEPFILNNLQFYDLGRGHFTTYARSIEGNFDRFYFIDYAQSKLGIRIDPARFPEYTVTRECAELGNFSVYRFTMKSANRTPAIR
ncbi:MAG: glycosyltransferase family 39 protein [Chlamydiota bacterium]